MRLFIIGTTSYFFMQEMLLSRQIFFGNNDFGQCIVVCIRIDITKPITLFENHF